MSLSLPRLCQPQSRPVCVGWCVVGGKRRVPLPPQIVSASPGLFVLAGVWWEVSGVSLSPQIVSAPVPACLCWLVCGGR